MAPPIVQTSLGALMMYQPGTQHDVSNVQLAIIQMDPYLQLMSVTHAVVDSTLGP
mgnify:CR=1 FL=1